jgi:hypothetical protein
MHKKMVFSLRDKYYGNQEEQGEEQYGKDYSQKDQGNELEGEDQPHTGHHHGVQSVSCARLWIAGGSGCRYHDPQFGLVGHMLEFDVYQQD